MSSAPPCLSWRNSQTRHEGVALIFVLWAMVLLSAIALEMAFSGHLRARATASTGDATKAFFLARSGVEQCIADLVEEAATADGQERLREDAIDRYRNTQVGDGTFTVYAGVDEYGDPNYGMMDESAKININTADTAVLEKLPGFDNNLAGAISTMRRDEPFANLNDLLRIEGMDLVRLYGEDQNQNGLLDANEDDGDRGWPPDNADGRLDRGLAQFLTTWSAARNVTADGEARVDLNGDSAETITSKLGDISQQQADSIVARREKGQFATVLDLLDVDLVIKSMQGGNQGANQSRNSQPQPQQSGNQPESGQSSDSQSTGRRNNSSSSSNANASGQSSRQSSGNVDANQGSTGQNANRGSSNQPQTSSGSSWQSTGQKAFDESTVRKIADLVTVGKDDVQPGLININTAPAEVLACLPGLDESLAGAIVSERRSRAGGFRVVTDLLDVQGLSVSALKQCYGLLTTRSDVFTARSFGVMRGGSLHASVQAVLDRSHSSVRILEWREND